jgi:hypothetical protein
VLLLQEVPATTSNCCAKCCHEVAAATFNCCMCCKFLRYGVLIITRFCYYAFQFCKIDFWGQGKEGHYFVAVLGQGKVHKYSSHEVRCKL